MSILTMTPCYSIALCFLAFVLIVIIAAPIIIMMLRKIWSWMDAQYLRIKSK